MSQRQDAWALHILWPKIFFPLFKWNKNSKSCLLMSWFYIILNKLFFTFIMNPVTQAKYKSQWASLVFSGSIRKQSFNGEKKGWKTKNLYIKIKIRNSLLSELLGVMEGRFQMPCLSDSTLGINNPQRMGSGSSKWTAGQPLSALGSTDVHSYGNCRLSSLFYTEAERITACSQDTMPWVRFPSNSLRKPKHDKWRGLCQLLFLSLSQTHKTPQTPRIN